MNSYIKVPLIAGAVFLISGCNIYRQMVIPTPYYPNGSEANTIGTPVQQGQQQQATVTNNVNETLTTNNSGSSITPIQNNNITTTNLTVVQRIAFPESEYRSLSKTGSATVDGHIYITTAGGNRVVGKNTRLYLNPVTSYSTQWFNKSYLGGAKMSKVDSRLFNYLKFTTSDSSGKFEFLNVPSGSYYLIGVVKCGTACGYDKVKNIRIAKKISVFGNDIKEVDLTKRVQ